MPICPIFKISYGIGFNIFFQIIIGRNRNDHIALETYASEAVDCIFLLTVYDMEIFLRHLYARMSEQCRYRLDVRSGIEKIDRETVARAMPCDVFVYPSLLYPPF